MGRNTARLAGGAAAAAILAVIVIALFPRLSPDTDGTAPDTVPTDTTAAATVPVEPEAVVAAGPKVDTFLLGPDGVAVIAGHGTPGAKITLLLEGAPLAEVQADASGSFAATADVTASDTPRSLTFAENDAAPTGDVVLVRPGTGTPAPDVATAAAKTDAPAPAQAAGADDAGGSPDVAVASADQTSGDGVSDPATRVVEGTGSAAATTANDAPATVTDEAAAPDTSVVIAQTGNGAADTASGPAAVTPEETAFDDTASDGTATNDTVPQLAAPTIVVDAEGARVLGQGPQVMDRVALDAITYDATGAVQLAGRAPGERTLQVYVDNRPVTTGPVGIQGDWRLTLPGVDPGTYTLRIDELAPDGSVASRVETPFRREAPEDVAALQTGDGGLTVTTQTVQPGNTLWAIARENLGEGIMYVRVFEANADQIRNPDLIYPGQVFVIPDR
ncbi:LysM peptidoglycan-binding domain-containing protein [Loktanella sp. DJP18]|uniref:LysM peptidoglycan-binding domain-containing protein n=1 Tax=Loktanella sp. DJP18 TaxID=3409788 RepID=UPI003BB5754D